MLLDDLRAIIPPGLWTPFREEQIAGSIAAVERAGAASTEATPPPHHPNFPGKQHVLPKPATPRPRPVPPPPASTEATERPDLREALERLVAASTNIIDNEVPSDEQWREFEAAYRAALATTPPAPDHAPKWIRDPLHGSSDAYCSVCGESFEDHPATPPAPDLDFRCDQIVNNGMGEPTECGRTLPCEHHEPTPPAQPLPTVEELAAVLDNLWAQGWITMPEHETEQIAKAILARLRGEQG